MSGYRLYRVPDAHPDLRWLDSECFPEDDPYRPSGADWWIVRHAGLPVAFAGIRYWPQDHCGFLCRAGVVAGHQGQGLQRRLIRARVGHAARQGWAGVYTYTHPTNAASANNLIACGFRTWRPAYLWGGEEMVYWWRGLAHTRTEGP